MQVIEFSFYWHFTHWPSFWGNTIVLFFSVFFVCVVLGDKICVLFEFFIHPFIHVIILSFSPYLLHKDSDLSFQITECERNALKKQPCLFLSWRCKENMCMREVRTWKSASPEKSEKDVWWARGISSAIKIWWCPSLSP